MCVIGGWLGSAGRSVATSLEVDDVGGVDEAVKDGLGDDGIREKRIPVNGLTVGSKDQRPTSSFGDKFIDVVGLAGGEVAHREVVED